MRSSKVGSPVLLPIPSSLIESGSYVDFIVPAEHQLACDEDTYTVASGCAHKFPHKASFTGRSVIAPFEFVLSSYCH